MTCHGTGAKNAGTTEGRNLGVLCDHMAYVASSHFSLRIWGFPSPERHIRPVAAVVEGPLEVGTSKGPVAALDSIG